MDSVQSNDDFLGFALPAPPGDSPCGYLLLGEIGRGGMGVVHRARDMTLGREVAIKILAERYPVRSSTASRFIEEARITGRLQHPGIPAVHEVGHLPDGRPYLAMKLIRGRTMDELLKERIDPGADHGRWLATFEAIAQAVGYAHSQHVVHRDLKPQNIMVGAFGEVQVMDWGLAKVVSELQGSGDASCERTGEAARQAAGDTVAGSVLGTPAYMPPEQARGDGDQIDARSDVFGLGAILCVILTGKPPYVGDDFESTRQLAERGRLEDAFDRLDASRAEQELVALCKRCLSVEKAGRPPNAGEVAGAVATLRAAAEGRARAAELDQRAAEIRSVEDRKRRHMRTTAAWIVATVLAVGTVVSVWQAMRAVAEAKNAREAEGKERAARQDADRERIGAYSDAEPFARQTLALNEREFGPNHLKTLQSAYQLAVICNQIGKMNESVPLLKRVVAGRERQLGADHIMWRIASSAPSRTLNAPSKGSRRRLALSIRTGSNRPACSGSATSAAE